MVTHGDPFPHAVNYGLRSSAMLALLAELRGE